MALSLGLRVVDPVDVKIFNIDWSPWLKTDTISASAWIVPAGLVDQSESQTTTKTSIKLSGFSAATAYTIYNTVTTSAGQIRRVSFDIECP